MPYRGKCARHVAPITSGSARAILRSRPRHGSACVRSANVCPSGASMRSLMRVKSDAHVADQFVGRFRNAYASGSPGAFSLSHIMWSRITVGGRHAANPREAAVSPPTQASPLKAPHRTATISVGCHAVQDPSAQAHSGLFCDIRARAKPFVNTQWCWRM